MTDMAFNYTISPDGYFIPSSVSISDPETGQSANDNSELIKKIEELHRQYEFNHDGELEAEITNDGSNIRIMAYNPNTENLRTLKSFAWRRGQGNLRTKIAGIKNAGNLRYVRAGDYDIFVGFKKDGIRFEVGLTGISTVAHRNFENRLGTPYFFVQATNSPIIHVMPLMSAGVSFDMTDNLHYRVNLDDDFPDRVIEVFNPKYQDVNMCLAHDFGLRFVGKNYFNEKR